MLFFLWYKYDSGQKKQLPHHRQSFINGLTSTAKIVAIASLHEAGQRLCWPQILPLNKQKSCFQENSQIVDLLFQGKYDTLSPRTKIIAKVSGQTTSTSFLGFNMKLFISLTALRYQVRTSPALPRVEKYNWGHLCIDNIRSQTDG